MSKKVKGPYKVGQVVFDSFEDWNGYATVVSVKDAPIILVQDDGGNQWKTEEKYLRPLTNTECGHG